MKKQWIKRISIGMITFTLAFSAMPAAVPALLEAPVKAEAAEITPRKDVIYWRYRALADGTIQKRRWNETRGYWVDPDWINVN